MTETKQIKVTLRRSLIGVPNSQEKIVKALGLTKTNQTKIHNESPAILGMLKKVPHLVTVE